MNKRICSVEGCGGRHHSRDYCELHYRRFLKHGDALKERKRGGICAVEDCDKKCQSKDYCYIHYYYFKKYGDPLYKRLRRSNKEGLDLIDYAVKHGTADECILWPGGNGKHCTILIDGKRVLAHREALRRKTGKPYDYPYLAAHGPCHNPSCINPHPGHGLRWATQSENHKDKVRDGTHRRGERNNTTKITSKTALAIYLDNRPAAVVAKKHNVTQSTVKHIRYGNTWAWLTGAKKP